MTPPTRAIAASNSGTDCENISQLDSLPHTHIRMLCDIHSSIYDRQPEMCTPLFAGVLTHGASHLSLRRHTHRHRTFGVSTFFSVY
jgi:hypothetical protein